MAPMLGRLMALAQQQRPPLPPKAVLTPVPLHPNRLRKRGFNQALLLTHHLRRNLPNPQPEVRPEWLRRIRDTPPQTELPLEERLRNPENAFAAAPEVQGRTVIVVDDVMTTGSTLNAIVRTLQAQGVREVSAWVLCRRVREPEVHDSAGVSGSH
ncbi:MAG TPA: ComF family protein [Deltaproteobacteria bacterium]|nr:ComF family protein [Deltaproteobacteria bacterium]